MLVLAADTATSVNTVALCDDDRLLAESIAESGRRHSERLMATVDWVLQEAGHTLADVELLAISRGPGSFTGLRVGVSAWKGLAFGRTLPLIGVPTLDAMARLVPLYEGSLCTVLDARMHEVFGAVYRAGGERAEKAGPDRVCPIEDLVAVTEPGTLFIGDGATLYRDRILAAQPSARFASPSTGMPRASAVAAEALALMSQGASADAEAVEPVYLRLSQAEEARRAAAANEEVHA